MRARSPGWSDRVVTRAAGLGCPGARQRRHHAVPHRGERQNFRNHHKTASFLPEPRQRRRSIRDRSPADRHDRLHCNAWQFAELTPRGSRVTPPANVGSRSHLRASARCTTSRAVRRGNEDSSARGAARRSRRVGGRVMAARRGWLGRGPRAFLVNSGPRLGRERGRCAPAGREVGVCPGRTVRRLPHVCERAVRLIFRLLNKMSG